MNALSNYKIFPLGDSAVTIDFGNIIDEQTNGLVISIFNLFQQTSFLGFVEAVPAYSSITIYYDVVELRKQIPEKITVLQFVINKIEEMLRLQLSFVNKEKNVVKIPVCYEKEFAPDLDLMADFLKLSPSEIISFHTATTYRVFMLGFLPGFAYMGKINAKIIMPRKQQPGMVLSGSVGVAGEQTGVYPLNSPGGWQIIGRTPLKLFNNKMQEPTLLKVGDCVHFYSITKNEFENIEGGNS